MELKLELRILIKLLLFTITLWFLMLQQAKAQDFDKLLEAGVDDAEKYLGNFIEPILIGFGYGLNNGWYNSAKPHKDFGVDLTVTANAAFVPDKKLLFNFANSDYNTIRLQDLSKTSTDLPTALGGETTEALELLDENGDPFPLPTTIDALSGANLEEEIGKNAIPVPMATLGIGIPKGTDLKLRFTPKIKVDDFEAKILGIGVMHNVKQWIPSIKMSPMDFSAFFSFTSINTSFDLTDSEFNVGADNQEATFGMSVWTFQGLVSRQFSVLTLYGGLGYNKVSSELKLLGTYDIDGAKVLNDPIALDFKSGGPRATAGFRLKLAILTLHADYSFQKYNNLTLGVGLSVR